MQKITRGLTEQEDQMVGVKVNQELKDLKRIGVNMITESTIWDISDIINKELGVEYGSENTIDYRPEIQSRFKKVIRNDQRGVDNLMNQIIDMKQL